MLATSFPYLDVELDDMDGGSPPPACWRHFHWGYYPDPHVDDDSPETYAAAAEGLTERLLDLAGVTDGRTVLDVGCGFGGTLDHIRGRNRGCALHGVNVDHRQLRRGRQLLADHGHPGGPVSFATADGCRLPVAGGSVDHVLAVECIFHFPSRKAFFREAARVLRPGGTLALSDVLVAPGASPEVAANRTAADLGGWYGHSTRPLTPDGYRRLGRGAGFEPYHDRDITANTLPTYPAVRRMYREAGRPDGVAEITGLEKLASGGGWEYHLLGFRRCESDRAASGGRDR